MWDERYSGEDYAYGIEPNDYLVAMAEWLPGQEVLCLGEGEGRNAVWLAARGFAVTAVDASAVGLAKARRLAAARNVSIHCVQADLADYAIEPAAWDAIVSIFCHLPPPLRRRVHAAAVAGLRPGGVFLLEAYTAAQLNLATGGPPVAEMMMELASLRDELAGLELRHAAELERRIHEGAHHTGLGAVVQVLGVKTAAQP